MGSWLVALAAFLAGRIAVAAPSARIWFDARAPYSRPMVRATIDERAQTLLLDTGSSRHVFSLTRARQAGKKLTEEPPLLDFEGRERVSYDAPVQATLDSLGPLPIEHVSVSAWADILDSRAPGGPHADGVLAPSLLAADDALVLDLVGGSITKTSWVDAVTRLLAADTLSASEAPFTGDGHYVVEAQVGGEELRLAVDTGAPHSLLYARRSDAVPDGAVRKWQRQTRIRVGELVRDVEVQVLEPIAPMPYDGLLGMDVLKDCLLALDRSHLVLRCRGDARAASSSASSQSPLEPPRGSPTSLCVGGEDGACLKDRGNGRYRYDGDHVRIDFRADGTFEIKEYARSRLSMRSTHDEILHVLEETALLRYNFTHARDLAHSFEWLPHHLASVWSNRRWVPAERREILFLIWDEAAEPDDPELGSAGARARRIIEGFVRKELPPGSALAFSDAELLQLNARRVRGPRFAPYEVDPHADRGE